MPKCPGPPVLDPILEPQTKQNFLGLKAAETAALSRMLAGLPRQFRGGLEVRRCFEALFQTVAKCPGRAAAPMFRSRVLDLLLKIGEVARAGAREPMSAGIGLALRHMPQSHSKTISRWQMLPEIAHMSESYFKATFRRLMGMPPRVYAADPAGTTPAVVA